MIYGADKCVRVVRLHLFDSNKTVGIPSIPKIINVIAQNKNTTRESELMAVLQVWRHLAPRLAKGVARAQVQPFLITKYRALDDV